jgi:putative transposase
MCYNGGLKPIEYDTVYHIVKKRLDPRIKEIMRYGTDAIEDYQQVSRGFSQRMAKAPLHIVEIDHTELDMDVIDEESGANLGRPWITLGIDVYTRMVWCMHVSFDHPSADKVRKAIQHGIFFKNAKEKYNTLYEWDIYGIPGIIYLDNGPEFKNAGVKRMIDETLKSQVMYRPVSTPRYGGTIERLFRTINQEFIHRIAGTRKSNPTDLGEYDAEKEAIFTLDNIIELLTRYITDVYHHDIHQGLPLDTPTPATRYYRAIEVMGYPDFIYPEDEAYYRIELLSTKMKMYSRDGIRDGNVCYASQETSRFISKQKYKYKIKYDLDDISKIYILDPSSTPAWFSSRIHNSQCI